MVTNFDGTFQDCTGVTSAVPTLWTTHASAAHSGCFSNVINATNYSDAVALNNKKVFSIKIKAEYQHPLQYSNNHYLLLDYEMSNLYHPFVEAE